MDEYLERIKLEGYLDSNGAATWELNLGSPPVDNLVISDRVADRVMPTARNARNAALPAEYEVNVELKKIKKHLKQMVDL